MNRKSKKEYLISLYHFRSVVALVAGILAFCVIMVAVMVKLLVYASASENRLHFFTVLSNLLAAVGASFMIPYAVEGIRKKRFTLPRWLIEFQYAGATCVAITFVVSITIILPTQGLTAVTGTDFWLHIIAPVCTVVLFQCVETGIELTRRDIVIAQLPFWAYMAVYYVEVVVIGEENGGWSDFYMTQVYCPIWVSLIALVAVGFGISALLRVINNKRAAQSVRRLTRLWNEDMEPVAVLTEVFGLGRYMGARCDGSDLVVPVDIFAMLEQRYGITMDRLTKAYMRGAMDTIREGKKQYGNSKEICGQDSASPAPH